jgi:hypothetical protein
MHLLPTSIYKSVANYKYMGNNDKNGNEIENRIHNRNACNHLVHEHLSHHLLYEVKSESKFACVCAFMYVNVRAHAHVCVGE